VIWGGAYTVTQLYEPQTTGGSQTPPRPLGSAFYPATNPKHRKVLSYVEMVGPDGSRDHVDPPNAHGPNPSGPPEGWRL